MKMNYFRMRNLYFHSLHTHTRVPRHGIHTPRLVGQWLLMHCIRGIWRVPTSRLCNLSYKVITICCKGLWCLLGHLKINCLVFVFIKKKQIYCAFLSHLIKKICVGCFNDCPLLKQILCDNCNIN